ncbi:hypothetical protein [Streptomyces sasae]|uniref:hypothetical protein n=1 Tax=Streptomyces sasae TaxID=1266772 RepID=UPI0029310A3D|nr:hypothetical protein [Streptomyces sasae]
MRWWVTGWAVLGVVALTACGASSGGGAAGTGPPSGRTAGPSGGTPAHTSAAPVPAPSSAAPGGPAPSASVPAGNCAAGRTRVTVSPGDAPVRRLCVRPGAEVSLVLRPRVDDRRWTAARSSAPVFVLLSGWRVDADGTAHASLRCAGTRGGTAEVGVLAKAPDVAGAAGVAFTLEVTVVPYGREG